MNELPIGTGDRCQRLEDRPKDPSLFSPVQRKIMLAGDGASSLVRIRGLLSTDESSDDESSLESVSDDGVSDVDDEQDRRCTTSSPRGPTSAFEIPDSLRADDVAHHNLSTRALQDCTLEVDDSSDESSLGTDASGELNCSNASGTSTIERPLRTGNSKLGKEGVSKETKDKKELGNKKDSSQYSKDDPIIIEFPTPLATKPKGASDHCSLISDLSGQSRRNKDKNDDDLSTCASLENLEKLQLRLKLAQELSES